MKAQTMPSAEAARSFIETSSFVWHQRWELVEGVMTPGVHPIDMLFNFGEVERDLRGKRVLDIGTSNGGAAFLMERWGAERVVAVDIYPPDHFGFRRLSAFLGSSVEYLQGSVYDLNRLVGGRTFDHVLFWGVLYHLRHPLLALDEVRSVLVPGGTVDIETVVSDQELEPHSDLPVARFFRHDELGRDPSNWFAPTVACLKAWCASAGLEFERDEVWGEGQSQRCLLVARRTADYPEFARISYEVPLRAEPR